MSGVLHTNTDGTRLVQYLQWATEADYLACISDRRWSELPSSRRFLARIDAGEAVVDARIFTIASAVSPREAGLRTASCEGGTARLGPGPGARPTCANGVRVHVYV